MYDIVVYDTTIQQNEIKKYIFDIINLIKECFNFSFDPSCFYDSIITCEYVFIAFDNENPIGIAFTRNETVKLFDTKKHTYTYIENCDDEIQNANHISLYPIISTLCRKSDISYKGTGNAILQYI